MLILVGVTVNVALNGGLFETAKKAARKTEKAKMNEEIQTIIAAMNADILAHPENHKITKDEFPEDDETITEELAFAFYFKKPVKIIEENFKIEESIIKTYTYGTEEFRSANTFELLNKQYINEEFFENGIVKFPCTYKENMGFNIIVKMKFGDTSIEVISYSLELTGDMTIKQTGDEVELTAGGNIKEIREGAPIPKGFYYVTGTKNTGVVISDNQADENNEGGNNGNQFVWVPVKVNPKLEIKIDSDKGIKTVRILNTDGYDETITVNSDLFEKTINPTNNSVYEIIAEYEDGSVEDKIYEVNNVYKREFTAMKIIDELCMMTGIKQEEALNTFKEEALKNNPDAVLNTKIDIIKEVAKGFEIFEDSVVETENVLRYGGFYIGRYEVGADGTIKKDQTVKSNISFGDAKTEAETLYNDNNTYGVKSSLPSAAAWDSVCKWLVSSGAKTKNQVYYYSGTESGNYCSESSSYNSVKVSGSSDSYKANNIYDLAGNLAEWTTETKDTNHIARGRSYADRSTRYIDSSFYSRNDDYSGADSKVGYRPILYFY